ncbi:MAG: monofunctional biosynthetic peptidoglycan transglycosylase [Zoogloeaceae bacterium]|jgi:monofunctional biosynthetic peptidoglycan transglycosylase|nr:monofunctional biosynthetic peptidoglycan transglycosylase [Zoogloeaceae bacterium]
MTLSSLRSGCAFVWRFTKRVLLAVLALFLLLQLWFLGWVLWWKETPPSQTSFMRTRIGEAPGRTIQYQWVPYAQISVHIKRALIAAEDAHFLEHSGFDWQGIQVAIEKNQRKGRYVAGGSTISQQLAKNLFLSPRRSLLRKGEEAMITLMLEACWDKERIFETYLNVIEWGDGIFGIEAAARHYYGVSAAQLTIPQAAKLAAMVPNPRYFERYWGSSALRAKADILRGRMPSARVP